MSVTESSRPVGIYARLAAARSRGRVVCVTGGRGFRAQKVVFSALDNAHAAQPISLLIEGGTTGADRLAREWATERGVPFHTEEALWSLYGQRAGPLRNGVMVGMRPDLVIAFAGGHGTQNMVTQAVQAGLHVVHITDLG